MADKNETATGKQVDRKDQEIALNSERPKEPILRKEKPSKPKK